VALGAKSGGNLGLTDAELDRVTVGNRQLGSALPQFAGSVTASSVHPWLRDAVEAVSMAPRVALVGGDLHQISR